MLSVLLIDDDHKLKHLLEEYFSESEISLTYASDGMSGLEAARRGSYDAIFLDVMMPGMSGLDVLRRLREDSRIPVIMLTARGDETDRVVGLEMGADDYLPKPFSPRELLARLRAVLRRVQPEAGEERLSVGGVLLEVSSRSVKVGERKVELTGLEFDLLKAMMERAGRVVARTNLMELAGRDVVVSDRAIDVHVSHLRKKLGDAGQSIRTVRGVGYLFSRDGDA